jgi:hypothetical protein
MRKTGRTLGLVAMAAVVTGMTAPALAATARPETVPRSAIAFTPRSGQSVVDWNRALITILGAPGAQPSTVHPTRSFALLQAAEYDAVTSITHQAPPYLFSVPAPRGARPDAAGIDVDHRHGGLLCSLGLRSPAPGEPRGLRGFSSLPSAARPASRVARSPLARRPRVARTEAA